MRRAVRRTREPGRRWRRRRSRGCRAARSTAVPSGASTPEPSPASLSTSMRRARGRDLGEAAEDRRRPARRRAMRRRPQRRSRTRVYRSAVAAHTGPYAGRDVRCAHAAADLRRRPLLRRRRDGRRRRRLDPRGRSPSKSSCRRRLARPGTIAVLDELAARRRRCGSCARPTPAWAPRCAPARLRRRRPTCSCSTATTSPKRAPWPRWPTRSTPTRGRLRLRLDPLLRRARRRRPPARPGTRGSCCTPTAGRSRRCTGATRSTAWAGSPTGTAYEDWDLLLGARGAGSPRRARAAPRPALPPARRRAAQPRRRARACARTTPRCARRHARALRARAGAAPPLAAAAPYAARLPGAAAGGAASCRRGLVPRLLGPQAASRHALGADDHGRRLSRPAPVPAHACALQALDDRRARPGRPPRTPSVADARRPRL